MLDIDFIEEKRKQQNKSVADLANTLGIDVSTWYRKKEKPEKISIGEIIKICKFLGLTAEEVNIFLFSNSQKCE